MNLHRNILCGRHPEYFSEDPLLSGVMAGFHAKGIESTGTRATYKHLFCNNSETSRKGRATASSPSGRCGSCTSGPLRLPWRLRSPAVL